MELRKYFELNYDETMLYKNFCDEHKTVLRKIFVTLKQKRRN